MQSLGLVRIPHPNELTGKINYRRDVTVNMYSSSLDAILNDLENFIVVEAENLTVIAQTANYGHVRELTWRFINLHKHQAVFAVTQENSGTGNLNGGDF